MTVFSLATVPAAAADESHGRGARVFRYERSGRLRPVTSADAVENAVPAPALDHPVSYLSLNVEAVYLPGVPDAKKGDLVAYGFETEGVGSESLRTFTSPYRCADTRCAMSLRQKYLALSRPFRSGGVSISMVQCNLGPANSATALDGRGKLDSVTNGTKHGAVNGSNPDAGEHVRDVHQMVFHSVSTRSCRSRRTHEVKLLTRIAGADAPGAGETLASGHQVLFLQPASSTRAGEAELSESERENEKAKWKRLSQIQDRLCLRGTRVFLARAPGRCNGDLEPYEDVPYVVMTVEARHRDPSGAHPRLRVLKSAFESDLSQAPEPACLRAATIQHHLADQSRRSRITLAELRYNAAWRELAVTRVNLDLLTRAGPATPGFPELRKALIRRALTQVKNILLEHGPLLFPDEVSFFDEFSRRLVRELESLRPSERVEYGRPCDATRSDAIASWLEPILVSLRASSGEPGDELLPRYCNDRGAVRAGTAR